ncbi:TonB-dependent receptor domain-containing protein [Halorhodospira neutriphila]|uniref:TonB-dependent receptor n=1 Tax=Halorhodospira neutriphila TaxID=168379 RepID=A0ABS1E5G7_9GAMM|nr:TonB-dependent receptor [Halorhodospira neutriphila]MBK1726059.1 TonB-dependent receptor [Halorhodospira neutriphila]
MQSRSLLAAGTAASLAFVAAPDAARSESAEALPPVVVTPTRVSQTVDETLSSVTVIEREAIERQQPKELQDLLQGRAGVSLNSNGAFGKTTSLSLRGTDSGHTLLLVDGMRLGSATAGQPAWQFLPPQQIERVEVVRGPRSSIYGADALGGVVQVFTRRGEPGEPRVNAFVGGGSLGTYEAGAGVSGGSESTRYSLSGGYFETDGINVRDGVGDSADDGYDNTSVTGRVSHRLSPQVELFASGLYAEGETEFDANELMSGAPYDSAHQDYAQAAGRTGARIRVTDAWLAELAYGHSRDEQETYYEGSFDDRTDTARDYLSWRNDLALAPWATLSVGTDWREARISSTTDYAETSRDNWGVYQLLTLELARHRVEVSSRYDDNEAYGGHTTGQLAWGYALTERWQARASYGTAFQAPSFNALYRPPGIFSAGGNPDLEPEESQSYEAGVRYTGPAGYVDVAAFRTDIDNLIEWVGPRGSSRPQNVEEARITGVELESGGAVGPWQLKGAVTLMDHGNPDEPGSRLDRRPNASLRLDIDRRWQDLELGATALARGRSFDGEERLAGYGLLNLRAGYHLGPRWSVRATVDNALDKEYRTAAGYNQPGRTAYLSIHYGR